MREPRTRATVVLIFPLLFLFGLALTSFAHTTEDDLFKSIGLYQDRYAVQNTSGQLDKTNPYTKLVGDDGKGRQELDGLRNFRAVLPGIVYRGGANNIHRKPKKNNMNPLPPEGLTSLCREGFDRAIYLYKTNYSSAQRQTACTTRSDAPLAERSNTLEYLDRLPLSSAQGAADVKSILELVYAKLTRAGSPQPVYIHCWNGWHASGMLSAIILRQFCGISPEEADSYWVCNTDGNWQDKHYKYVRQQIRDFTPIATLSIGDEIRQRVCPHLDPQGCPQR